MSTFKASFLQALDFDLHLLDWHALKDHSGVDS